MKDRSDDPTHHERTLLPQSYISHHEIQQKKHQLTNPEIILYDN